MNVSATIETIEKVLFFPSCLHDKFKLPFVYVTFDIV